MHDTTQAQSIRPLCAGLRPIRLHYGWGYTVWRHINWNQATDKYFLSLITARAHFDIDISHFNCIIRCHDSCLNVGLFFLWIFTYGKCYLNLVKTTKKKHLSNKDIVNQIISLHCGPEMQQVTWFANPIVFVSKLSVI